MKSKKLSTKIIDIILNIVMIFCAFFLLISIYNFVQVKVLKNDYSNLFGYALFEVETGSMKPTINPGDWIIVKATQDIKVNDIVTYKQGKNFITHRVIESYKGTYVTKGDNNNTKDKAIDQSQIIGRKVKILPRFGIIKKTVLNPVVIIVVLITIALLSLYIKMSQKEDKKPFKLFKDKPKKEKTVKDNISKQIDDFKDDEVPNKEINPVNEEEISKTRMFRIISVNDDDYETVDVDNIADVKELEKALNSDDLDEMEKQEESMTKMFRIIHVEEDPEDEITIPEEEIEEEKPTEEEKKPKKKTDIKLEALEIEEVKTETKITKDYITNLITAKKAKNVLDKAFFIKKIIYDEIINVLLQDERVYIIKSSLRTEYMNKYLTIRYFGLDEERANTVKLLKEYHDKLTKQFIRDERKRNIIDAYTNCFLLINKIENKKNLDLKEELNKLFIDYPESYINNMALNINNIINFANQNLQDILEKFESNSFSVSYNKFNNEPHLIGTYLEHNINFSKVYSDYIVDKTYNEGVISEDKLAILVNMLLCRIINDLNNRNFNDKYFIYIPKDLYDKDKKLDHIASLFDNDYAKSHIYITTTISNMLRNKEDIKRLKKKGYQFAVIFNQSINLANEDLGYLYMADYYFVDENVDFKAIKKTLPKDIVKKTINDNITKRLGNIGGDL